MGEPFTCSLCDEPAVTIKVDHRLRALIYREPLCRTCASAVLWSNDRPQFDDIQDFDIERAATTSPHRPLAPHEIGYHRAERMPHLRDRP